MEEIRAHIMEVCQRLFQGEADVTLEIPEEQFGDLATNVAMQLAGKFNKKPRDIAEQIAAELDHPLIASTEVAGPGFINLKLTSAALITMAISDQAPKHASDKTVVIETNNPNPFKAMHIGHGYNAILADTIANLIKATQVQLHRVSYHGDVGTHVGKSMYSLLRFVDGDPSKLDDIPKEDRNSFMSRMYADGAQAYSEDETAKREIERLTELSFTLDDSLYKQVYETCKAWSFDDIDALVARLGNQPTEKRYLESEADSIGVAIVKDNTPDVFIESDGALIFPGEKYGIFDNAFVSSKGRGLYGARDLGLMKLKQDDFSPDKSYIVTAHEQKDYFRGVIKAAEQCFPEQKDVTVNIPTGQVTLKGGKMSSRTGDIVEVRWLFDQLEAALQQQGGNVTSEIVRGAIRYQFLKHRVSSDIIFDINESINTHGNSGPYLQYAHCRALSILRKAGISGAELSKESDLTNDERSLVRKISHFGLQQSQAIADLAPHHICSYLYELSQNYNRFYEHNRVIGDERESTRLAIVSLYAKTLKTGLELLGIPALERM